MYICSLTYNIFALLLLLSDGVLALYSSFLTNGSKDLGRSTLRRRQLPTVAITGIQGFGVQTRLEIRRLEQNVDQWNIFLLGLVRFQATDQSDLTSYYQIAGIHGRPYSAWDNVLSPPGVDSPGYCQHVLNSFLPWHRPYLALFEQTLYDHIIDAVNEFPRGPARQRYAAAALTWRFPYWDWAAPPPTGQSVYPSSLSESMVTVTMPNGTNTIPNPLHSYNFHPVSVQDFYYNPVSSAEDLYMGCTFTLSCSLPPGTRPNAILQAGVLTRQAKTTLSATYSTTIESLSKIACTICSRVTTTSRSSATKRILAQTSRTLTA